MGCCLRREMEEMLSLVPGEWSLELHKLRHNMECPYVYKINGKSREWATFKQGIAAGWGKTKREALEDLLEKWRSGKTLMPMVPARCREELKMVLDLEERL